jgi:hypothetical protein
MPLFLFDARDGRKVFTPLDQLEMTENSGTSKK